MPRTAQWPSKRQVNGHQHCQQPQENNEIDLVTTPDELSSLMHWRSGVVGGTLQSISDVGHDPQRPATINVPGPTTKMTVITSPCHRTKHTHSSTTHADVANNCLETTIHQHNMMRCTQNFMLLVCIQNTCLCNVNTLTHVLQECCTLSCYLSSVTYAILERFATAIYRVINSSVWCPYSGPTHIAE